MVPATRRQFLQGSSAALLRASAPAARPNIVVIYIDDMGYGQPGCYGGKLAPTPNFDSIAANGVRFTDGYVSAPVCSPSRVGLMTGRYQARTGHDANTTRPGSELLLSEVTMGQYLQRAGYATGIVGKWHLGASPQHLPSARGFDFSVGSVANLGEGAGPAFFRGAELIDSLPGAPVTSPYYASEACRFIDQNKAKPFFLYLPLNAVHAPHVASPEWLDKFSRIADRRERAYAALIGEMDAAIGTVLARLRTHRLEENTLLFCLSDNGGAGPQSDKKGLRGGKWNLNEGGIRVSYVAQWKGRIPAGRVESTPVIQLDILPTALAAADANLQPSNELDGVNLLPLLEGRGSPDREALYWRFGVQYAVRAGGWKLVKSSAKEAPRLHNLRQDPQEAKDLAAAEPARAHELQARWDRWNAAMKPPRWEDRRWLGDEVRQERKNPNKKREP